MNFPIFSIDVRNDAFGNNRIPLASCNWSCFNWHYLFSGNKTFAQRRLTMFDITIEFIIKLLLFIVFALIVKTLTAFLFKRISFNLVLSSTLLTAPMFFYIILSHDLLFGKLSFYTVVLLIFTLCLFEYNILIKRLFNTCTGLKIATFIIFSNILSYGIIELIYTLYL